MNYVRSLTSGVSKGWNSINPATLSGAIDVIVVELEDGTLACSPFHVRFGKYQILRPSDKKVQFTVNDEKKDYAMKLGEGGEAFFVFETTASIPEDMQTSPLASPASSPEQRPREPSPEPEPLQLDGTSGGRRATLQGRVVRPDLLGERPKSGDWSGFQPPPRSNSDEILPSAHTQFAKSFEDKEHEPIKLSRDQATAWNKHRRSTTPPPVSAMKRRYRSGADQSIAVR